MTVLLPSAAFAVRTQVLAATRDARRHAQRIGSVIALIRHAL